VARGLSRADRLGEGDLVYPNQIVAETECQMSDELGRAADVKIADELLRFRWHPLKLRRTVVDGTASAVRNGYDRRRGRDAGLPVNSRRTCGRSAISAGAGARIDCFRYERGSRRFRAEGCGCVNSQLSVQAHVTKNQPRNDRRP